MAVEKVLMRHPKMPAKADPVPTTREAFDVTWSKLGYTEVKPDAAPAPENTPEPAESGNTDPKGKGK